MAGTVIGLCGVWLSTSGLAEPANESSKIQHSFLACGAETRLIGADGKQVWSYPQSTRDGWVLPNGHLLLALSKSGQHPGGAVVEVTREGQTLFSWEGTQSEVNTVQALKNGNLLVTEAGDHPRVLELTRGGAIALEFPIQCQTTNHHLESRMTRKLDNGHYLVPQLLDKVVREYTSAGKIVWECPTPNWPFTAIRLKDGHTLIACTVGNLIIEVDQQGREVWRLENKDLPNSPLSDICGAQRLPNGNTVVTSYRTKPNELRLMEVTRAKQLVWTYTDAAPAGIHHFQILDTNGQPLSEPALK